MAREDIATEPEVASIVSKLFEWYATGQYALKDVAQKARDAGFVYRRTGAKVPVSAVHSIYAEPVLHRSVRMERQANSGKHQPLVSIDLWERVQGVLKGRNASKHRRMTHDFAFSGLINCHQCGCAIVGEIKKQKYVYYHCTGYADKSRGSPAACHRRYVREEVLEKQFTDLLGQLQFDDEVLEWVREALYASHADERREHEEAIRRLQAEHKRIGDRINAMYLDKLDGRVDGAFFDKKSTEWREEQNRCLREIERHQSAEQSYMDEGIQILELARNAQKLFAAATTA
jgi:site-specific DNA recombinase